MAVGADAAALLEHSQVAARKFCAGACSLNPPDRRVLGAAGPRFAAVALTDARTSTATVHRILERLGDQLVLRSGELGVVLAEHPLAVTQLAALLVDAPDTLLAWALGDFAANPPRVEVAAAVQAACADQSVAAQLVAHADQLVAAGVASAELLWHTEGVAAQWASNAHPEDPGVAWRQLTAAFIDSLGGAEVRWPLVVELACRFEGTLAEFRDTVIAASS